MTGLFNVVRPADLLVGTVELENLAIRADGSELVREAQGPASVILRLPAQHYVEPAVAVDVAQRLSRHTELLPDIAPAMFLVPLLAGLDGRWQWDLPDDVERIALGPGEMSLFAQLGRLPVKAASFPLLDNHRLNVFNASWVASATPATDREQHPLWRLALLAGQAGPTISDSDAVHETVPLDAVFTTQRGPDYNLGRGLLAEAGIGQPAGFHPRRVFFRERFHLHTAQATALGGTAAISGPLPPSARAMTYEHRTSLGRDVLVRDATWGWLSSGHRAVLMSMSERTIRNAHIVDPGALGAPTVSAAVDARLQLVIPDPVLDLAALADEYPNRGHEMPFVSLTLSPASAEVDVDFTAGVVRFRGAAVRFDLTGVDPVGRVVGLRMELAFIPDGTPSDQAFALVPAETFVDLPPTPFALAAEGDRQQGSTTIMVTGLGVTPVRAASRPFLPQLGSMAVGLDALAGITGRPVTVLAALSPTFRSAGLDRNLNPLGELLTIPPTALQLPTSRVGGLGNPGNVVDLVSAEQGLVSSALTAGPPTPAQLARAFSLPMLLGSIPLGELLDAGSFLSADGQPGTPVLLRTGVPGHETLTYSFKARLRDVGGDSAPAGPPGLITRNARVELVSRVEKKGGAPAVTSSGSVTGIQFELSGFARLEFSAVRFETDAEGKTRVDVAGAKVVFLGALEFLAEIARRLEGLSGGAGPRVDVDAAGVTAGFELAIPSVAVGALQLSNLSVSSFLRIPFDGAPLSFTLQVAKPSRPFLATVSLFGGGGYLTLELTSAGIKSLDASVEFGGSMSLDLIVASGGVTVMAGVRLVKVVENGVARLDASGFVRASGHVTVLGIVSIFVEFRLALTYSETTIGGKKHALFSGEASVTVGVRVLFVSKALTLTVRREFLGSATDPPFAECLTREDWSSYCAAFAGSGPPAVAPAAFGSPA